MRSKQQERCLNDGSFWNTFLRTFLRKVFFFQFVDYTNCDALFIKKIVFNLRRLNFEFNLTFDGHWRTLLAERSSLTMNWLNGLEPIPLTESIPRESIANSQRDYSRTSLQASLTVHRVWTVEWWMRQVHFKEGLHLIKRKVCVTLHFDNLRARW